MITADEAKFLTKKFYTESRVKAIQFCDECLTSWISERAEAGESSCEVHSCMFFAGTQPCDVMNYLKKCGYSVQSEDGQMLHISW